MREEYKSHNQVSKNGAEEEFGHKINAIRRFSTSGTNKSKTDLENDDGEHIDTILLL